MALTLVRAAPLHDESTPEEIHIVESLSGNDGQSNPIHVEVGNHSMNIASPTVKEHHHHQPHQVKLEPKEEIIPCCSSGEELAQHVIKLRDFIETLPEDDFDGFLEHYLKKASKDEVFALELALDLDGDDSEEEDEDDSASSFSSNSEPWEMEDDESIKFVPLEKLQKGHHGHNHQFQHQFERQVGCSEKEIKFGFCDPMEEYSSHHRHHQSHGHHHHHLEEELECSQVEQDEGLCVVQEHRQHHHSHPHSDSQPRHGVIIGDSRHSRVNREFMGADGYPLGQSISKQSQQDNDADLLGKKIEHSIEPISFAIIQQAIGGPLSGLVKPRVNPKAPQDAVKLHIEGVSMVPQDADQASNIV